MISGILGIDRGVVTFVLCVFAAITLLSYIFGEEPYNYFTSLLYHILGYVVCSSVFLLFIFFVNWVS